MMVVGNGESRADIDLSKLKNIVGCNALHRDLVVDHLVCVDQRCVREALISSNCKNTSIYTRPEWINYFNDPRIKLVPPLPYTGNQRQDDPFQWGSGGYAVILAAHLSNEIELIGFDLWSKTPTVNNVYKGTQNYSAVEAHRVDPSYWIYQISKVFEHFSDKYFTVYNDETWPMPDRWKMANVCFKSIDILR
jgi:hypothetical protein